MCLVEGKRKCFGPDGQNGVGDPPLSIPNREVKPNGADGTA